MSFKIDSRCVALPPAEYFGGTRQKGDSRSSHQVHTFSHQNKCRLTDLCTDAHWAGHDLQITMMVLEGIRGETVEFTMFTLLIPFYQKTEITLKVPSAFSQLSLPLIQIIASFISKLLHVITLLFPFLFPSLAFLLPFIHPLCCFHSISPFPNSTVYSSLCPSSIVHLQGILHIISICFVSLPSSLSLSLSLPNLSRCVLFYLSPWRYPPSVY